MPQRHDAHDDLAALDFSGAHEAGSDDGDEASAALDFSVAEDHSEESAVDALYEYAPSEPQESGTELEAIHSAAQLPEADDAGDGPELFTVTNPPATVSVSALMDGRTQRVDLSPNVTSMTESEVAEEILVLADLARQKGLAGQHTHLLQSDELSEDSGLPGLGEGVDLREFMENFMQLPTPEQADAAQSQVFATRYAAEK
ncbi:hypothetical protein A5641_19380 [Mycobacterium sp. 1554424.7]|nr:hypothetical protein A5641_19380 [Mycobacterium sp. 1554424.7]